MEAMMDGSISRLTLTVVAGLMDGLYGLGRDGEASRWRLATDDGSAARDVLLADAVADLLAARDALDGAMRGDHVLAMFGMFVAYPAGKELRCQLAASDGALDVTAWRRKVCDLCAGLFLYRGSHVRSMVWSAIAAVLNPRRTWEATRAGDGTALEESYSATAAILQGIDLVPLVRFIMKDKPYTSLVESFSAMLAILQGIDLVPLVRFTMKDKPYREMHELVAAAVSDLLVVRDSLAECVVVGGERLDRLFLIDVGKRAGSAFRDLLKLEACALNFRLWRRGLLGCVIDTCAARGIDVPDIRNVVERALAKCEDWPC